MGVVQPQLAIHQKDRNRHHHRRQHPSAQDEKEPVGFAGHFETAEGIGRQQAENDGQNRRCARDDHRIAQTAHIVAEAGDLLTVGQGDLFIPDEIGPLFLDLQAAGVEHRTIAEQIDKPLQRRREVDHFGGNGDGVGPGFEGGQPHPKDGDEHHPGQHKGENNAGAAGCAGAGSHFVHPCRVVDR